jgi:hypothetical protein
MDNDINQVLILKTGCLFLTESGGVFRSVRAESLNIIHVFILTL